MAQKTAVVTGCTEGGIGYYLASELLDRGWQVVATVRRHGKEGPLSSRGAKIVIMDIESEESIQSAKADFLKISPTLELLINNAGAGGKEALIEVSKAEIEKRFSVNVFGLLLSCQAFGQIMAKQGSGTIVNVGSVGGMSSVPWLGLYCATKAAVRSLTTTLAYELEPLGVKVIHLAPALIHTPFSSKADRLNYSGTIYEKSSIDASEEATDVLVDTENGRGMAPAPFAKQVLDLVLRPTPPPEIIIGTDDWIFKYINPYLPTWLSRKMVSGKCKTNGLKAAA